MNSLAFRLATEADLPLIVGSWVDSYRDAHACGPIPMPEYDATMTHWVRDWYLQRPGVKVWVAYHPEETSESKADLYGWCVVEHNIKLPRRVRENGRYHTVMEEVDELLLHYVYVKKDYRGEGLARMLLKKAGIDVNYPYLYLFKTGVVKDCSLFANGKWVPLLGRHAKE